MVNNPFFSICICSQNREKTIWRTLESLLCQSFIDFEVKIVDYGSTDNTRKILKSFFNSKIYLDKGFDFELKFIDKPLYGVEDWNEPIRIAKGKYIAMLEGDDVFLPNHLENAFRILNENKNNIGIYSTGNQFSKRYVTGIINSSNFFIHIYSLLNVPPPSETIFIRERQKNMPYFFNEVDFIYAPEIDLYLRISLDGYNAYYDNYQDVWREPTIKKKMGWKYYHDHLQVIKKYSNNNLINADYSSRLYRKYTYYALSNYWKGLIVDKVNDISFRENLIREIGLLKFIYFSLIVLIKKII